jgi:hypothetical protein
MKHWLASVCVLVIVSSSAGPVLGATDHFLTIGGGGSPRNNQLSLERNVVYFRKTLADCGLAGAPHAVYFACGNEKLRDLQVSDPNVTPPRANVLLARLWDREDDLYNTYRPHDLPEVKGPANRASIAEWFRTTGARLADGDRLFVYFTGHGGSGQRGQPRNTTMDLWFDGGMTVKEFTAHLDKVNPKAQVVLIMVQCHSGGFADVIFPAAAAGPNLADATRCGFFATWHDRLAAGCTPDTQEENYQDYTTFFFAALAGRTRTGQAVDRPDYDGDGRTSLAEAHAYVQLTSDRIDIPVCTGDVLLRQFGKTKDAKLPGLVTPSAKFDELLKLASADRRAVLEGLSEHLGLTGDDRAAAARKLADELDRQRKALEPQRPGRQATTAPGGGGGGAGGGGRRGEQEQLRNQIRSRVLARWPEISNGYHPAAVAAITSEADQIVKVIESHPAFARWDKLVNDAGDRVEKSFELERKWVKCQRFLYVAESVALEANLEKVASKLIVAKYQALRAAESGHLGRSSAR